MEKISKSIHKKAMKLLRGNKVNIDIETEKRTHFTVKGETEEHMVVYDKIQGKWLCDCKFFVLKEKECSHIYASKILLKNKRKSSKFS
ncbi:MAG: hypothetical protein QXQ18_01785 [Candidatus Aenigmatarchaeota archaeon]